MSKNAGTTLKGPATYEFDAVKFEGRVDRDKGIIRDVSVITSGVRAKGHNLEVDDITLRQMLSEGKRKGKVGVKWNHGSGADAISGHLKNFRIITVKGSGRKKLKADWHLLKSHDKYERALELAETMPECLGLSAAFTGENEKRNGKEYARCTELLTVDLVGAPAANPEGMFEARPVDSGAGGMAGTAQPGAAKPTDDNKDPLARMLAMMEGFEKRFDAIDSRFEALEAEDSEEEDEEEEEEEEGGEPGAGKTEFNSLSDVFNFFEARFQAAEDEAQRVELEQGLEVLGQKFGALMDINETLLGENELLALTVQELQAKTKTKVELSAGTGGEQTIRVIENKGSGDGKPQTEFEARVAELTKAGKPAGEALLEAMNEDLDRYQKHLQAKGAIVQNL